MVSILEQSAEDITHGYLSSSLRPEPAHDQAIRSDGECHVTCQQLRQAAALAKGHHVVCGVSYLRICLQKQAQCVARASTHIEARRPCALICRSGEGFGLPVMTSGLYRYLLRPFDMASLCIDAYSKFAAEPAGHQAGNLHITC